MGIELKLCVRLTLELKSSWLFLPALVECPASVLVWPGCMKPWAVWGRPLSGSAASSNCRRTRRRARTLLQLPPPTVASLVPKLPATKEGNDGLPLEIRRHLAFFHHLRLILISANNINLKPNTWEERPLTAPEMSLEPLVSLFSSSLFLCHEIKWTPGQGILSLSLTTFLKFSNNHWSLYPFFRWEIFLMPFMSQRSVAKNCLGLTYILCVTTRVSY